MSVTSSFRINVSQRLHGLVVEFQSVDLSDPALSSRVRAEFARPQTCPADSKEAPDYHLLPSCLATGRRRLDGGGVGSNACASREKHSASELRKVAAVAVIP